MPAVAEERRLKQLMPTVGVMAVLIRDEEVLMVRRSKEPDAERWSLPAGKIEWGEDIGAAALRELAEETSISAIAGPAFTAVDAIDVDQAGAVRHHFVIVAVPCQWLSGEPHAGDDALEARWFRPADIEGLALARGFDVAEVIRTALQLSPSGAR